MKTSNELRTAFLEFFKNKGHTIVNSSALVPGNDPTLLFTNAGMVQFKDVFLGQEKRSYNKAASSQRCVRAGGKHNDLDNVGYTARHHTFFEMLGNFSFGDYFKRDAIKFAWELLTEVFKLPPEKLWITVFEDDDEAADIWLKEIKVDPKRFSRCGAADNFWAMGDTGPCGPCTEIFYDHGPEIAGGPPGTPEADGDRYIEIWNLVFMQFERSANGDMKPLPKPSVDTGMGLERLAAVMQRVHNNYDTDLFQPLIERAAELAGVKAHPTNNPPYLTSLRVIADHIRSCSFLILDGIVPSNEGRGYVLRRIIRRAIRHGHQLGLREPFFHKLVAPLAMKMGEAYPDLITKQKHIEKVLLHEEQQFARTLDTGMKLLEQAMANLDGEIIPGETVFKLYDTYGFPTDLTADIAREHGLTIDQAGFEKEMTKQRQRSQEAEKFSLDHYTVVAGESEFIGYHSLVNPDAKVTHIYKKTNESAPEALQTLKEGERGFIILDRTPFYAESGGQVGDTGYLLFGEKKGGEFIVENTQKQGQAYLHSGIAKLGDLKVGDKVFAKVDAIKRNATMLNHTATHLLHAALRKILGEHVMQKGSLVEPARLRFDFTHTAPMTIDEIKKVEHLVNQKIRENLTADIKETTQEQATQEGALAFFGEKYGEKVRVLTYGDFSKELCGGTHVEHTGTIGFFKIISETGIAAGIRRLEAVTGEGALNWIDNLDDQLRDAAKLLKTGRDTLLDKLQKNIEHTQQLEKQLEKLQHQIAGNLADELAKKAKAISNVNILIQEVSGIDPKKLRELTEQLKNQLKSCIIVLGMNADQRAQLIVGVSKDISTKIQANELINVIAPYIGGKGGGRPDLAQAGGDKPEQLTQALQEAHTFVEKHLQ